MRVKELIKILEGLEQERDIKANDGWGEHSDIKDVVKTDMFVDEEYEYYAISMK